MSQGPDYGYPHRKLRAQWQKRIDRAGGWPCNRCGNQIPPREPKAWQLDHDDDDPTQYRGPACSFCNGSAGALKRWAGAARPVRPRSRQW